MGASRSPAPAVQAPRARAQQVSPASRRDFCRLALSTGILWAGGWLPRVPAARSLDLNNQTDLLRAMIKMRGSLDSDLVIGWLRAKRFAVSRGRIEPLCGLIAATFSRFRQVSDELVEAVALEVTHYTDFETGALLDELTMPFANTTVTVPPYRFGPARTRFAVDLDERERFAPQADTTESDFSPAGTVLMTKSIRREGVLDGDLLLRHEEHGRVYPDDSEVPTLFYKESTIWSAPEQAVLDSQNRRVNSRVSYSAMTSWRPWMQMGDLPGHTSSNGFGGRVDSIADLPEDFLRYTEQRHPDVLEDPESLLQTLKKET
jgi:hypothetical protein